MPSIQPPAPDPDPSDRSSFEKFLSVTGYTWHSSAYELIHPPHKLHSEPFIPRVGQSSLGRLEVLPVEVQHLILQHLDLESLETMRTLNSTSNILVNSFPAYREVRKHAHEILRGLAATRLLSRFTASRILNVLCADRCVGCGKRGALVFLPTLSRCCYPCMKSHPDLQVIKTSEAEKCYGLTRKQLKTLPVLWSIPLSDVSNWLKVSYKYRSLDKSVPLVSTRQARDLGIDIHGSLKGMRHFVASKFATSQRNLRGRILPAQTIEDPYTPKNPGWSHPYDKNRGLATIGSPFFDRKTQQAQQGYHCRGCLTSSVLEPRKLAAWHIQWERTNTAYSEAELIEQYKECEPAKSLWASHLSGVSWMGIPLYSNGGVDSGLSKIA